MGARHPAVMMRNRTAPKKAGAQHLHNTCTHGETRTLPWGEMQAFVKALHGKTFAPEAEPSDSIKVLVQSLQDSIKPNMAKVCVMCSAGAQLGRSGRGCGSMPDVGGGSATESRAPREERRGGC